MFLRITQVLKRGALDTATILALNGKDKNHLILIVVLFNSAAELKFIAAS